uniref:Isopenicillin N synthase-like Fe(2+) 2OG dioxygenase domain-containing protein n=1 Tax=Solanum lycopersicum TaxID=4081 RepID=A0A3Q7IEP2_SOLLC
MEIPCVFLFGDSVTPQQESRLVDEAWRSHGFFLVENHIVYANLISSVHRYMDTLFYMPLSEKTKSLEENLCALLQCLSFTRSCLGKRLSLRYFAKQDSSHIVEEYFQRSLGESFNNLELTFETRCHYDPTPLTVHHQDCIIGLHVFVDNKWYSIPQNFNRYVVNIGNTYMEVLSNGRYKNCLLRVVVVNPPTKLVDYQKPQLYHDFTWPALLEFTQTHHRAYTNSIQAF